MCKAKAILREAIKYHNSFKNNWDMRNLALKNPILFNANRIIEETLAHIGFYNFVDEHHRDYDDDSDCKTSSIRPNPMNEKYPYLYQCEIAAVVSPGGTYKAGALRVIMHNPHDDSLHYFYIPKTGWEHLNINIHPTTGYGRIITTYDSRNNTVKNLEPFRVNSLRALALAGG